MLGVVPVQQATILTTPTVKIALLRIFMMSHSIAHIIVYGFLLAI